MEDSESTALLFAILAIMGLTICCIFEALQVQRLTQKVYAIEQQLVQPK